jgi:hypothetical protein
VTLQAALAFYAAVLSTVLALAKLLPEKPIVVLEPVGGSDPPDVRLLVFNPSRRPLFIEGCTQRRRAGSHDDFGIVEERPLYQQEQIAREFLDRLRSDRYPRIYVPPEKTAALRVSKITDGADRVVVIWWHRNWWPLSFLKLPTCVRVTAELARMAKS